MTKIDKILNGDQLIHYWESFEDHIKKYDKKIDEYKSYIEEDKATLKQLVLEKRNLIKNKKLFDEKNLEPHDYPLKYEKNADKELKKKCHDLVKFHEINYHLKYLIEKYDKRLDEPTKRIPCISYEMLCDHTGKFKYIRCPECYKSSLIENDFSYSDMNIEKEIGSK